MDSYIDRDLRNRLMRQREHELKMYVSNRASALPSVENVASSSSQRNRVVRRGPTVIVVAARGQDPVRGHDRPAVTVDVRQTGRIHGNLP